MNRERLKRIRNWQSTEFYSRLVMRPLSILAMLVIADWEWLTPNIVTTGANLAKFAAAILIALDHRDNLIAAAILLQLGLLLDHLDGTIARYRRCGTTFGAFYDKVSDAVTWLAITTAIGFTAYRDTGRVELPILAIASAYLLLVLGYMKWIVAAAVAREQNVPPMSLAHEPPDRTPREWLIWFGSSIARAAKFEEVDLFFWIGIGLVIDRLDLTIYLLAVSQLVQLAIMVTVRTIEVRKLDGQRERTSDSAWPAPKPVYTAPMPAANPAAIGGQITHPAAQSST